jgi:hypothetical protein
MEELNVARREPIDFRSLAPLHPEGNVLLLRSDNEWGVIFSAAMLTNSQAEPIFS